MYGIVYVDTKGKFNYFTHLDFFHCPNFVCESRKEEAQKFDTAKQAERFFLEHFGLSRKFHVVEI